MGLSDVDANNMLGTRFGRVASNVPSSYEVGLSSTPPADDGTNITEPADTAWVRPVIANNGTTFPAPAGRMCAVAIDIWIPAPVTTPIIAGYYFLADAATHRVCDIGRFARAVTVPVGVMGRIPAGSMVFRVPPTRFS